MTEFALPLTAEGSVTAPSGTFNLTVPAVEAVTYFDAGSVNVLEIPEFGYAVADGINPLRLITGGTVYTAGGLAPSTAPTVATSGARATTYGVYTGQPADGETFIVGVPNHQVNVTWKATLVTNGTVGSQVKIGATADDSYTNLQKFIESTGTHGTEYWNELLLHIGPIQPKPVWKFAENYMIECPSLDTVGGSITLRYVTYGTIGNTSVCTEAVSNFAWTLSDLATPSTVFTGGADGSTAGPDPGTYRYFHTWYRSTDGAETGRSPIASITKPTNDTIAISGLTGSADTTFDFINIYRSTNSGVEFYQVGAVPRATTTFTDDVSDTSLLVVSGGIAWNELLHRDYTEGMPPRGRALALWKGAIWSLGARLHADYTRGTVSVTVDSASITFSIQGVSTRMVNRTFIVDATSEEYTILAVDETTKVATLDRAYEGSTNATATFKIRDDYNARRLRRCVPFKYNQWPVDESPGEIETDDNEGGLALLATDARLFAFSRNSIISVTGEDGDSWDMNKVATGVGCVASSLIVDVEGGGMFLSHDGFYALSPDGTLTCISSPKAPKRTTAQGIEATVARIAWANVETGYSEYDGEDRVIIFGVPLDGATTPNYEIVFDLQNGAWTLNKRAEWTTLESVTLPNGGAALLAGDREGYIWHANIGASDGFYGTEAVQTLSGAQTVRVLTVSGTPYSTSEGGKPVIILYADGSTVAYGKVASSTTSALTLADDLATAPVAGDQVILGGIGWQAKSGFTTGEEEYLSKTLRAVTLRHAPTTRGDYFFSFAVDGGSYRLCPVGTSIGSLAQANGKVRHMVQWPGDTHSINIRGFKPGGRAVLRGGIFDFVTRSSGRM